MSSDGDAPLPFTDESDLDQPRCHHYTLAHQALKSVAFDHPIFLLGVLVSEKASSFLADLMESVREHCQQREPVADFTAAELRVHPGRIGQNQYPCVIVELPCPRATAEAYFVAVVLLVDLKQQTPDLPSPAIRYFTLEKGFTFGGPPLTVLCEWTAEAHLNYGPGPQPQLEAFAEAIEQRLDG